MYFGFVHLNFKFYKDDKMYKLYRLVYILFDDYIVHTV